MLAVLAQAGRGLRNCLLLSCPHSKLALVTEAWQWCMREALARQEADKVRIYSLAYGGMPVVYEGGVSKAGSRKSAHLHAYTVNMCMAQAARAGVFVQGTA